MKQKSLLTRLLLLFVLIIGSTNAWADDTYVKVTDASGLVAGNKYLIVYENGNSSEAAGAQAGNGTNNYRTAVGVSASSSTVTITNQAVTVFTLGGSTGAYTLLGSDGNYLCKNSTSTSSNNYLQSSSTDTDNKTKWTITYSNNVVTIKNNFATSFTIRYNSRDPRFSCYTNNSQNAVALYRYTPTLTYSINPAASGTIAVTKSGDAISSGSAVASGTVLNISAEAGSGMQFKNWTVTGTGASVAVATSATTTLTMGSANTTLTANFETALAYSITPVVNNASYGSAVVTGSTITATPNAGYRVMAGDAGYTVTTGTATVVNNGDNTFTVTPSTDCTVQINFEEKDTPDFSFASATANATYGGTVTPPALTNDESTGVVTYESSNTKVATVDENTGEVTPVSVGTTTITATVAEDEDYKTAQASYTLTVNEDATASGASNKETFFSEGFGGCNNTGGNDSFNGSQGAALASSTIDSKTDNAIWNISGYVYPAYLCVRVGKSDGAGSLTTDNIDFSGSGTLTFRAAGWSGDSSFSPSVSGTNCTLTGDTSPSLTAASWGNYTVNISNATSPITITISGKRYFLDDIVLSQTLDTYCVSATIPTSTWGTYCSPYALDFSNAATTVTAFAVSDYDAAAATITFAKITGKVPAKTPIVITGTAGAQKIAVAEGETSAPATNLLRGYLSPAYYAGADASETLMGLSGGTFKKMQAGTIPANKAVLVMDTDDFNDIPDGDSSKMTFIFEEESETDGIKTIHNAQFIMHNDTYNLAGQRVGNDYKGIIIENGKKVVRK